MIAPPEPPAAPPRLLDRVRWHLRVKHYSLRTEELYAHWIRRFILFHGKRHPAEMGEEEIAAFLSHLAIDGHVAASTQNQRVTTAEANQAMQLTASKPVVYAWSVCRRDRMLRGMHSGLAAADLVSR